MLISSSFKSPYLLLGLLICFCACKQQPKTQWVANFPEIGCYSSPRVVDLNKDGVLDIILGGSKNEFLPLENGVIAINGQDGKILWTTPGTDQVVGSAVFEEVTGDGIADVFIGGRKNQLYGINGATGALLWSFLPNNGPTKAHELTRFNFYNSQLIPDQNGDGFRDLIISNGGNVDAPPRSMTMRFPGTLAIISSKTGTILNVAAMPDNMETYMSPIVHDFKGDGQLDVIFGSGGETIGGSLYRIPLTELLANDLSGSITLATGKGHGFIAPVSLADINKDGILDIIANWHGGKMYAIDGANNEILWQLNFPKTEFNNTAAIGHFTDDDIPDIYAYYSKGEWPNSLGTVHFVVDGRTGKVVFQKLLGCSSIASGVAFDYDNDHFDEIVISVNKYNCVQLSKQQINQILYLFDFNDNRLIPLDETPLAKNISATPWVGDLDGDKKWDLIYPLMTNSTRLYDVNGMVLKRLTLPYTYQKAPAWGGYMGTKYDGVFYQ